MAWGSSFTYGRSHGRNKIATWEEELSRFITGNQEISIGSACWVDPPAPAQTLWWAAQLLRGLFGSVQIYSEHLMSFSEHKALHRSMEPLLFLISRHAQFGFCLFNITGFYKYSASDLNMYQPTTQREMPIFVINTLIYLPHIYLPHSWKQKQQFKYSLRCQLCFI